MLDLSTSTKQTAWFAKDQAKARQASKFIGRGSLQSSTNAYRIALGTRANTGSYASSDIVFISAEGARRNRVAPNFAEIGLAITARATFVTDAPADRMRAYNCGEREVAEFLLRHHYRETRPGWWEPPLG